MNQHRSTLRVTATSGETANALVRRQQFSAGRPLQFDAEYPYVTPLEYALGAVGAEIVNGVRAIAKRRRIPIDAVEAVVHGDLDNPLAYFDVVGIEGHPELRRIALTLYVASPAESGTIRELWNDTKSKLPLARAFTAAGLLDVTLTLV